MLELGRALAERVPVVLMCYANLVLARGVERFADELAKADVSGLIVPDLPLEEAPAVLEACDAAGIALVPLVAPTTPGGAAGAHRRAGPRLPLHGLGDRHDRRARRARRRATCSRGSRRHASVPVALGFGIATPEQAAAAAAAGADGVIVGTRLVRAAAEGEDVRALVEGSRGGARPARRVRSAPRWGSFLTTTAGLVIWIVLWALDVKAFDAFMITVADRDHGRRRCGWSRPSLPGNRPDPEEPR